MIILYYSSSSVSGGRIFPKYRNRARLALVPLPHPLRRTSFVSLLAPSFASRDSLDSWWGSSPSCELIFRIPKTFFCSNTKRQKRKSEQSPGLRRDSAVSYTSTSIITADAKPFHVGWFESFCGDRASRCYILLGRASLFFLEQASKITKKIRNRSHRSCVVCCEASNSTFLLPSATSL